MTEKLTDHRLTSEINTISNKLDVDQFLSKKRRTELISRLQELVARRDNLRKTLKENQQIENDTRTAKSQSN